MDMNKRGFTLVEILIASSVGLIVLGAIYASMNIGQRSSVNVERKVVAQQEARAALGIMAMEIRMASYNPCFTPNSFWCNPANCSTPPVSSTYKGIQEATANSIAVEMDIGGSIVNPVIGDSSNEIIRYNYDAGNLRITRETNCGGAQPFLGDVAGQREVRVVNSTAGISLFTYYDVDGNELVPGTDLPAGIPQIRRVRITLVVDTEEPDPNLGKRRRAFYSTNVIPRNHAID